VETEYVVVWTTVPAAFDARELAATVVRERLAACVNVLGEMDSIYRWKGEIETDRERQVIMKTTAERVAALRTRLHELHQYAVPEFIVLPVIGGSDRYLSWVRESTTG
jgi:periplasmic divalent cation tolerance protein